MSSPLKIFSSALLIVCALGVSPSAASAQEARDPAAAEMLFRQGRAATEAKDYALACAKFRESQRLDPAVGTLFNIANCEEQLGHVATAWTLFREVSQRLPSDDERSAIAERRAAALEPRLPRLTVHVEAHLPGTRVLRDGVLLGDASLDTPLPIDPGEHSIVVELPGHDDARYALRLAESESRAVAVAPGSSRREPIARESAKPTSAERPTGAPAAAYVFGTLGVAGLVAGTISGVLVLDKKSTVDDECIGKACSERGASAARAGKTLGVITTASLAVGVLGLGTGLYLFVSAPSRPEKSETGSYVVGLRGRW
jgi:hypothetical protein